MALPAWAPPLTDVAVHILSRTREVGDTSDNDYAGTFTTATIPTGDQVTVLIGQACTLVQSRTGLPVMVANSDVTDQCRLAAALWAAYWVELAQPERDADVRVYEQIRRDAEAATAAAVQMNTAAGGGTTTDPTEDTGLLASYAAPTLSPLADTIAFW